MIIHFRILFCTCLLLTACAILYAGPSADDIFVGNDTPGPFALSWNHVLPGTETVTVNGLSQMRGLDYTLDTDNGSVTFTRSLPTHSAAQVRYERDPLQSQQNGQGKLIPLSVDLMRSNRGYLSFNALAKSGAAAQNNLTLGVGLGWHPGGTTQLATRFFFAPITASSDPTSLTAEKRSGLSLSGSTGAGQWALFSFGFARAGVSLGDSGDSSVQAGQQSLLISSRLTPVKTIQALVSYTQNRVTDDLTAPTTSTSALSVTITPTDKTQMLAKLATTATGSSGTTQTVDLSVHTQPIPQMQVSAAYGSQNAPGTVSDTQSLNLKTVLAPSKTLSIDTTASQSQQAGVTTSLQSVGLTLRPHPTLQIDAALALSQKGQVGQGTLGTSIASISAAAHPLSFLEVSGSYKSRTASVADTDPNDQLDSRAARIALSPLPTVHLIGTFAQNPDDTGLSTLQRLARTGVGLETNVGALGLTGGCDWSHNYDTLDVQQTIHAGLGLRFSAATQLSVGYQSSQNPLDPVSPLATSYTVGFTHSLGDRFNLTLSGKSQKTAPTALPDYNATANLGMKF